MATIGESIPKFSVEDVAADHIRMMAVILRDANPIHFDVGEVQHAGLGDRLVNQGGSTLGYIMEMLVRWAGSRAAVKGISCRFSANVFAGDSVTAGGTVVSVSDDGTVGCEVWARRSDGVVAVQGTAKVFLD